MNSSSGGGSGGINPKRRRMAYRMASITDWLTGPVCCPDASTGLVVLVAGVLSGNGRSYGWSKGLHVGLSGFPGVPRGRLRVTVTLLQERSPVHSIWCGWCASAPMQRQATPKHHRAGPVVSRWRSLEWPELPFLQREM